MLIHDEKKKQNRIIVVCIGLDVPHCVPLLQVPLSFVHSFFPYKHGTLGSLGSTYDKAQATFLSLHASGRETNGGACSTCICDGPELQYRTIVVKVVIVIVAATASIMWPMIINGADWQ